MTSRVESEDMDAARARALLPGIRRINGWFSEEAAMMFALVDALQRRAGLRGDLFEIGAHHGKSAVMLAAMADAGSESLEVCDLFGGQHANVSQSGAGDRRTFEANLRRHVRPLPAVRVFEVNSKELTPREVRRSIRFFHIDGGHNGDEALSDMELAAATLVDNGVIVVDDAFRADWPGVTEGIVRFLDHHPEFCAMVAAFNKLWLARRRAADLYRGMGEPALRDQYDLGFPWSLKRLPFLDAPLTIFHIPPGLRYRRVKTHLVRYYHRHSWLRSPWLGPVRKVGRALLS